MPTNTGDRPQVFRSIHRALADPLRLRLLDALWLRPRSAKELARWVDLPPDRLYYHLHQLQQAKLIEVVEYRELPSGKIERVYGLAAAEPPGDAATSEEIANFLGQTLEATRADINQAFAAKAAGATREVRLVRTGVHLSAERLVQLRTRIEALVDEAVANPDPDGIWTRVLLTLVDLQDRDGEGHEQENPR